MKVLKFGGTSVGTSERMRNVLNIVEDTREGNVVIVLSAMSGTTNKLKQIDAFIEEGSTSEARIACNHLMVVNKHFNRIHSLIELP